MLTKNWKCPLYLQAEIGKGKQYVFAFFFLFLSMSAHLSILSLSLSAPLPHISLSLSLYLLSIQPLTFAAHNLLFLSVHTEHLHVCLCSDWTRPWLPTVWENVCLKKESGWWPCSLPLSSKLLKQSPTKPSFYFLPKNITCAFLYTVLGYGKYFKVDTLPLYNKWM